jgi:hypothetical protein
MHLTEARPTGGGGNHGVTVPPGEQLPHGVVIPVNMQYLANHGAGNNHSRYERLPQFRHLGGIL